ncbi:hypothetical protein ONE63_008844 [Megalurothrips usitatus]|uniref:tRNA-splicing endonuclease subunit Sen34 n=1 Tax=Megalurothrips usitatus TaxID=439358 RepID=A0AAV7XHN4_9NEOP|nr:hypothetical protein ONE63_008844 [Megalurothrips usitatus]
MITVPVSEDNTPLIWNAEDWIKLREEHRIVGALVGVLPNLPNQEVFHGLPMSLLPEETTLLLELNIICLKKIPSLCHLPGENIIKAFENNRQKTYLEQENQMKEERKLAVMALVDKIVEGRRRKQLGLDTKKKRKKCKNENKSDETEDKEKIVELLKPIEEAERQEVLEEELSKVPPLSKESALTQTFTTHPWLNLESASPFSWTYPNTHEEKIKYRTFKDLWNRGFYISSGHKFGGDFLVYPGDPVKFHSQFIVLCVSHSKVLTVHELVSFGRIGSSVRKSFVLASSPNDSGEVIYQSIKWAGSNPVHIS